MEIVAVAVPLIIVTVACLAFLLGRARDNSLARKIGREVGRKPTPEDPVLMLEKLHQLRQAGALTEAEYEAQKARILAL